MKKFMNNVSFLASLIGMLHTMFLVPEPNSKQVVLCIFYAAVIIITALRREEFVEEQNENQ